MRLLPGGELQRAQGEQALLDIGVQVGRHRGEVRDLIGKHTHEWLGS
ncbi:hypothetical protein [Streptomyces sp. L-9-10]|nr:hypothetical protein [Streptomyces sp. L-9-10]